jgi:apolipoprotein N-acyltransferase
VTPRDGRTIYSRLGEKPIVGAAVVVLVAGLILAGWDQRRRSVNPPRAGR